MLTFAGGMPVAGRYLLVERLHVSAAAQLWSAFDDVLGRPVAVKFFPHAAGDERARNRLYARARTAARISHPHLGAVLDFGDASHGAERHVPYVVSALIDGVTLTSRLVAGPLTGPATAQMTSEIAEALAAMHVRGVTHGALETDAVMLTDAGAMLLGAVNSRSAFTAGAPATAADDVRALARLALHATAAVPLDAEESEQRRIALEAGLSRTLTSLLLSCLAQDPRERPDAATVARGCGVVQARHTVGVPSGAHPMLKVRTHRAPAGRFLMPVGLAAVSLLGLVVVGNLTGVGDGVIPQVLPAAITGNDPVKRQPTTSNGPGAKQSPSTETSPAAPATSGAPEPSTSNLSSPSASVQAARRAAIDKFRAMVEDGQAKGELTGAAATELLTGAEGINPSANSLSGKISSLVNRVNSLERAGKINEERAELLKKALQAILDS